MSTMTMHTLPIDADRVRRMVQLTSRWQRDALERTLVEYGWVTDTEVSLLPWCESQCAPFYFGVDGDSGSPDSARWRLDFGCPPESHDHGAPEEDDHGTPFIQLLCALKWPAFGQDPDPEDPDEFDDFDDNDGRWTTHSEITRADWDAEFDRLGALLRGQLGTPAHTETPDKSGYRLERWQLDDMAVVLVSGDDINSYSFYDAIFLRICPAAARMASRYWPTD
ncbi:hypothetical protein OG874_30440 [Nocardia sp. NBC_00565]|uniref:hypothetical protein n=1 Tax=Nocardia sp. NBC_00565 TaxID=2975993 RepID=UPI002E81E03E|nr:hypothetical protein [Nocardia sp. NBC_00565]WUC01117.1 hypothetical protein OG874_30440 [Nocardia sp. NBC_00565]